MTRKTEKQIPQAGKPENPSKFSYIPLSNGQERNLILSSCNHRNFSELYQRVCFHKTSEELPSSQYRAC